VGVDKGCCSMKCWIKIAVTTLLLTAIGADFGLRVAIAFASPPGTPQNGMEKACVGLDCLVPDARMDWTAWATVVLVIATGNLAWATFRLATIARQEMTDTRLDNQAAREEAKIERTVAACIRYEADVTLVSAIQRLRQAGNAVFMTPIPYTHEINLLLNYLDTIAIGIQQAFYDEQRAKVFMQSIVRTNCGRYLNSEFLRRIGLDIDDFNTLVMLHQQWS